MRRARAFAACMLALVLVLSMSGCAYTNSEPAPTSTPLPPTVSVEQQARLFMDRGAVAAVVQVRWPGGEWSKAYGVRDLDAKTPAQPTDRVQVASITKTMTAVTVLKLVDDGLIRLDDPVNDVIPGFKTLLHPPGPITVRQLLGHISGIPEYTDLRFKNQDQLRQALSNPEQITPKKAFELAGTQKWDPSSVGTFSYSSTGYEALGLLVQTLRHKPYAQVLREEVIDPLGLKDTSAARVDVHDPRILHGYITLQGQRLDVTDNADRVDSAAAGATSTVADVDTFFSALFQGKLISAKSLAELEKRPSLAPYALGVWTWPDGCKGGTRYEGRGGLWDYLTFTAASDDGRYVATMTVVPPPLPTELEGSAGNAQRDLWSGQMESVVNETLDRLCLNPD
jgi:D-alanyl-D-alanine carboxypeptidase